MAQDTLVPGFYPFAPTHAPTSDDQAALIERLARGELSVGLFFAGQGFPPLDTLATLYQSCATVRRFLKQANQALAQEWRGASFQATGLAHTQVDLVAWLDPELRPAPEVLLSTPISHLTILSTQIAQYICAWEEGLHSLWSGGHPPKFVTGHSQGMLSALLVAECNPKTGELNIDRAVEFLCYALWQGACMERAWRTWGHSEVDGHQHMVAIAGPDTRALEGLLEHFNQDQALQDRIELVIHTTRTRHVISGPSARLIQFHTMLEHTLERAQAKKKQGQFAGRLPLFQWDPIPVAASFHHPMLKSGIEELRTHAKRLGFVLDKDAINMGMICSDSGTWLQDRADGITDTFEWFAPCQFVQPVRWRQTMQTIARGEGERAVDVLIDLGPGDGIARLTRAALRGSKIEVISLANADDRKRLYTRGMPSPTLMNYEDFKPQKRADGRLENFYTRATNTPPFILPGMTPTTTEVPIVAAGANAGYWSELAGGGQPTEAVFWERMRELKEQVRPGMGVIFNALYLDRRLWELHMGQGDLVVRASQAGYPLCGVTITAGIPPVKEAVALLDRLVDNGIWKNAFKPGNVAQVKQVVEIAHAAPEHLIFVHLEGGKAGGHHSWEDLNDLLLDTYHMIRRCPNLVLCVGGGIGTPERAADYLDGSWSRPFGELDMPVDAIFMGTIFMAAKEAMTSDSVKQALVDAAGTDQWVFAGKTKGLVTSGKSGLNADIHYLDNPAARCGLLLDAVAGDDEAVITRREEIIEALNLTAKPYFGDVESMTYVQLLERMIALMAIGNHTSYEDGPWPDASYRTRFAKAIWMTEARLHPKEQGTVESLLTADLAQLDDPKQVLNSLLETLPLASTTRVTPEDAIVFLEEICKMPGKPINFIPVIDADVRRWYKSDALWQAHDARWSADEVLVIPGPEAVAGIEELNEPVKSIFTRFMDAISDRLSPEETSRTRHAEPPVRHMSVTQTQEGWHLVAHSDQANWFSWIADHVPGPLGQIWRTLSLRAGEALRANPLRKLCMASDGAQIWIDAQSVRCRPDADNMCEVTLTLQDNGTLLLFAHDDDPRRENHALFHLPIHVEEKAADYPFFVTPEDNAEAILDLYGIAIFGTKIAPIAPFALSEATSTWSSTQATSYLHSVGDAGAHPPLNLAFSMAWKALFSTLADSEFAPYLLQLVHLSNDIKAGEAWPPKQGELSVSSQIESIERGPKGCTLRVRSLLTQGDAECASVTSAFFIRDLPQTGRAKVESKRTLARTLVLDQAGQEFLFSRDFITADTATESAQVTVEASLERTDAHWSAQGSITLEDGTQLGTIAYDLHDRSLKTHPLIAALDALEQHADTTSAPGVVRKLLFEEQLTAPSDMMPFALASGDKNPIHTSPMFARLANLDGPIVHGMWTAGAMAAALRRGPAAGDASRITALRVEFLSILEPGAPLHIEITRTGVDQGSLVVEVMAYSQERAVARASATVKPPRTAYLFPGQGIQRQNMGMDGFNRSKAAKSVWNRADAHTQSSMGFSILDVVRRNPSELWVNGTLLTHPQGVLNLTQFTQVAMATLARAQMAELREADLFIPDAIAAGHSIGEYNVIGAVLEVLPLEETISVVYQRGLAMHQLVERDAQGQSNYAMGVIRPHYARMSHEEAEALVDQIASKHDAFLQIVNYNVKGKQYAVTGTLDALALLEKELAKRAQGAKKSAFVPVPGIDVPFHSRALTNGVASFRQALETNIPTSIDYHVLVGRYVPNLTATPFEISREYIEEILTVADTPRLHEVLEDWDTWSQDEAKLARRMLIELLAWQFASPVRWIETQDLFFTPKTQGGLGVEQIVEIGVGTQPTVANMAKATLAMAHPGATRAQIYNVEADFDLVFHQDQALAPVVETTEEAPATESVEAAAPQAVVHVAAPSTGTTVADRPPTHMEGLKFLIASQANLRPEQIVPAETIDEIFEGVSSKRNQLLMDLGTEFGVGAIDGAHEKPISDVVKALETRAPGWRGGPYVQKSVEEATRQMFGRTGTSRADLEGLLEKDFGLGKGLTTIAMMQLALERREGASVRGGDLGKMSSVAPSSKAEVGSALDTLASCVSDTLGETVARATGSAGAAGGVVSSAEVQELAKSLMGEEGVLMQTARAIAEELGHPLQKEAMTIAQEQPAHLDVLDKELGEEFAKYVGPRFDERRHVKFGSNWATAQRQVAQLFHGVLQGTTSLAQAKTQARRLAQFCVEPRVQESATWHAAQAKLAGHEELAALLGEIAKGQVAFDADLVLHRPSLSKDDSGQVNFKEVVSDKELGTWLDELFDADHLTASTHVEKLREHITSLLEQPLALQGRTALITGASPNSIAAEVVGRLLAAGAQVIVTTTTSTPARMAFYRRLFDTHSGPGATLHVVTFNQASLQDVDALVNWLFEPVTRTSGGTTTKIKDPTPPDLVLPFGAIKDLATTDMLTPKSEAAMRALLTGVERLITSIARARITRHMTHRPCHVILPLSPNHGTFGGDGLYGESKAALEVLMNKWHSEQDRWGQAITLCGTIIGWVRSTGLMDANDMVAPMLEEAGDVTTFSSAQMGWLIAALCADEMQAVCAENPWMVNLSGGLRGVTDLRQRVGAIRQRLQDDANMATKQHTLNQAYTEALGLDQAKSDRVLLHALPSPMNPVQACSEDLPEHHVRPEDMVVIVGAGEVGPYGSSRARFEYEVTGKLSAQSVLEVAWAVGLIERQGTDWVKAGDTTPLDEATLADSLREDVMARIGIRHIDPESVGFDPAAMTTYTSAFLDRDITMTVATEEEAQSYLDEDPERTLVTRTAQGWEVTRKQGSAIRVPRRMKLNRTVAGTVPDGFDFSKFGISARLQAQTDRVTLFNIVATVDAWLSSGITPEEILENVHPARIGNTQSSGIGGMKSLDKLYIDPALDKERQADVLQETLLNVMAAYIAQSYMGSYGPMSHPVGACATAALSLESGMEKILLNKADFVITGGFDDIGTAGMIGFADMNATAPTDDMLAKGLHPRQFSRSNDSRRGGFVEGQGGGTMLLTRGDIARDMGLPVLGVVGYANSFGDGVQRSIPAPGLGILAVAAGGKRSPLAHALGKFGLTTDDIGVVYKHDTSTHANDINESKIHHTIQDTLGRTPGNPLWVVSQKTLTGHSKGGAAAWQTIGLCQTLANQVIAPNRNLDDVDPEMKGFNHLCFTTEAVKLSTPIRAGLVTSLGFGHVGAIVMVLHPDFFAGALEPQEREAWRARASDRLQSGARTWSKVRLGDHAAFQERTHRRFHAADGTRCQTKEEMAMLLDPEARLKDGVFVSGQNHSEDQPS